MNCELALTVIEQALLYGVQEFCVAPGARNAALVYLLAQIPTVKVYYWSEERSAAFFALGRIKATHQPVAVVTTSGTAAAELLPATIEAYYTSLPLLLITADRPRRFRLTGAPQSIEQVGLFGCYTVWSQDLAENELCQLKQWSGRGPCHLNVCFEEPSKKDLCEFNSTFSIGSFKPASLPVVSQNAVEAFFQCQYPFVVVGALNQIEREAIQTFLIQLKAPVYFEAQSGLREESSLKHLRIESIEDIWTRSRQQGYPIDGVLRIGSVPTARFWRDLEETNQIRVYSISENPFTGISEGELIYTSLLDYFQNYPILNTKNYPFQSWKKADQHNQSQLLSLFAEEPSAEPSLIHFLSKKISAKAKIYIGNSLPIREWDQASDWVNKYFQLAASRGANGIDGQLSTFLGFASQEQENWAILGDLTTLYDLVAPWIMNQIQTVKVNVVVINNGGGQIFASKFAHPAFLNEHQLNFKPFADFWGWHYECWHEIPSAISNCSTNRLIELIPNNDANQRFHKKKQTIK